MKVKNRKTGIEYEITIAEYNLLVERQLKRNFIIIDKGELPKNKLVIPKEIIEYQQDPSKLSIKKDKPETK